VLRPRRGDIIVFKVPLRIWDPHAMRLERTIETAAPPTAVAVSPDGRRILAGGWDNQVHSWSLDSGAPLIDYLEFATEPACVRRLHEGGVDLAVLDGEAAPSGGMGIAKRMKTEIYDAPPVLLLTGRPQDAWLATWSQAEGVVPHPIDPVVLAETAAALLRPRLALTQGSART